ncbi:MAG: DUF4105 domain-containing protein [Flavobacterium sp.]|nr:MAG: DUF4105 domain-containing protein [Flavobacterium sp.]
MKFFKIVVLFLFFAIAGNAKAQRLSSEAKISLLTCGPGNELYSVFGHTALRISDPLSNLDIVYNYGTFDFDTPNFYLKFAKGDLQYLLSSSSYEDFVYTYVYYDRDVFEQVLNLTSDQKQKIADELREVIATDKRFYTYKFIHRNCTTMASDRIQPVLPSAISKDIADRGKTYREILFKCLENNYFENLGISLLFGYNTDRESNLLFLPYQLMEGVGKMKIAGTPLSRDTITVYKSTGANNSTPIFNSVYFFCLLLLPIIIFSGKKTVYMSWFVIIGLLGIIIIVIGMISLHIELSLNYNTLLINPLYLLLYIFLVSKKINAARITTFICMGCIAVYTLFMLNKPHLFAVAPLIVTTMVLLFRSLKSISRTKVIAG